MESTFAETFVKNVFKIRNSSDKGKIARFKKANTSERLKWIYGDLVGLGVKILTPDLEAFGFIANMIMGSKQKENGDKGLGVALKRLGAGGDSRLRKLLGSSDRKDLIVHLRPILGYVFSSGKAKIDFVRLTTDVKYFSSDCWAMRRWAMDYFGGNYEEESDDC